MAANTQAPLVRNNIRERTHYYHAEATILSGRLEHPLQQPIENYGHVVLENTRREELFTDTVGETNIAGLISFRSGHKRVIGTRIMNKTDIFGNDHAGWVTLSAAVLEDFNAVDIVTADRVVAQVSTEHPMTEGHVPRVSFLGTTFENLRIGGYPVEVELDLGVCGSKPADDRPYLRDDGFLDRVERQFINIVDSKGLPQSLKTQYDARIAYIEDLRTKTNGNAKGIRNGSIKVPCSLVKSIGPIPVPGVKTFGNLIFIPNFGTLALAELEVGIDPGDGDRFSLENQPAAGPSESNYFTLNMFDMHLGCPVSGQSQGSSVKSNGQTYP